ncbi:hypothetical protein KAI32_03410 [Candidatus Pacearchaeota archaeon]|nr:hypothetical protein [Candidatus Pacearchaeota archaeon]
MKGINECFANAIKDEKKGKKHKGLLIVKSDNEQAREYLIKAKTNLELCNFYKEKQFDYKIPEEWFYTLYYCALAILSKFGVESRSQRCTASFLKYLKNKNLIDYDEEFIDRITVYRTKNDESDVDKRETARYGSSVKSEDVERRYEYMNEICKRAISQCEELVFSDKDFKVPEELRL